MRFRWGDPNLFLTDLSSSIAMAFLAGIKLGLFFYVPLVIAAGSGLYYAAVTLAAVLFHLRREKGAGYAAPVSILKPVRGIEQNFYACLASHFRQDYPAFEMIFGLSDPQDPARWTIEQLRRDFPQVPVKIVVVSESCGANPKMSKLQRMLEEASHEVIVINDADIRVPPDYLHKSVQPLADEQVGLVTCLYRGIPVRRLSSILEALGIGGDFAGQVVLARLIGGFEFGLGATLATRQKQIAEIGGLAQWADYLADDYVLANQIAKAGYRIHLSHTVVETMLPHRSLSEMLQQQLRWARTVRTASPRGYPGLVLTFGIPFALAALLFQPASTVVQMMLAAVLLLRWLSSWASGVVVCRDPVVRKWFWLLPLRDLLAFGVWIASFCGSTVVWRDARYRLEAGGRIRPA
ncbi:MAG: bacteriohopanetetrol glucosamine biosynthesis glycosyltransferase HpnI [Acidobacteria bacterium]|nr:bacteriohopanetetrol glucosamine biosynthesis glycosyltransferase HpnI [Acidobacteriota bacterium]